MQPKSNILSIPRAERSSEASRFFPEAQGHEKILATCKKHETPMRLTALDGAEHFGVITQFDRWSITLRTKQGTRQTFYKHGLLSFSAE